MYKKRKWFLAQIRGHSAAANRHQSSSGQVRGRSKEPRLGGDPHFSQELHLGELRAIVSYVYIASLSQGNIMPSSSYRYIYILLRQRHGREEACKPHKPCSTQHTSSARLNYQAVLDTRGKMATDDVGCLARLYRDQFLGNTSRIYICRDIPIRPPFG